MAKYVQPTFDVYGVATFKNNVYTDSSVFLRGSTHISDPVVTSVDTPYALVVESVGGDVLVKQRVLGTMAWATASNYSTTTEMNTAIAGAIDDVDSSLVTYADNKFVELAGDTMTGLLTLATAGVTLDGQNITNIDSSSEGLGVGLDTHIPTSAAVKSLVDSAISAGVTASNGLNEISGDIQLGGELEKNTTIDVSNYTFEIKDATQSTQFYVAEEDIYAQTSNSDNYFNLATGTGFELFGTNGSFTSVMKTDGDGLVFEYNGTFVLNDGNASPAGVKYAGNYDSTLTEDSLIPKRVLIGAIDTVDTSLVSYVDSAMGDVPGATNGLQIIDGSIGLGGTLTEAATTIITNGATNSLRITNLATSTDDTPFAFISDTNGGDMKIRELGSMAWESSINYVDHPFLDASLADVYTAINNVDSSLGLYVEKAGDTMSGPLTISAGGLSVTNDVSISGGLLVSGSGGLIVSNDAFIGGSLTIDGSLYVTNVETIDVSAAFIHLNTGLTGTPPPTMQSGMVVGRGSAEPYVFLFDETGDTFRIGVAIETSTGYLDASTQAVATREDAPSEDGIAWWNNTLSRFDTDSGFTFTKLNGLQVDTSIFFGATGTTATENTALMILSSGEIRTRDLGSNAFSSDTFALKSDVDTSVNAVWTKLGFVDTSLNSIWTKFGYVDTSISNLDTLTQGHTTSISSLNQSITDLSTGKISGVANINVAGDASLYSYTDATHVAQLKKIVAGSGATITEDASTVTIAVSGAAGYVSKYTGTFTPDGSTSMSVLAATHSLGTGPLNTAVYENNNDLVQVGVDCAANGDITFTWIADSLVGECKYIITG